MSVEMDRVGDFRGEIIEYALSKSQKSQAVGVMIRVAVYEMWGLNEETNEMGWFDWRVANVVAVGQINLVKADGSLNERQVKDLATHAGWDGRLSSISAGTWHAKPIGFKVEEDEYEGRVRYRISWLNSYDATPSAFANACSAEDAALLEATYGAQLRALVGNTGRAPAPAKGPTAKAPASAPKAPAAAGRGPARRTAASKAPYADPNAQAPAEPQDGPQRLLNPDEIPF